MADFTVTETRTYEQPNDKTYQAALQAIAGLEGKVMSENKGAGTIKGQFDKKIHGKVLGDRSEILVQVANDADGKSSVAVEAYPINPVGQKLLFGARKGVVPTVVGWFWAHLEHNL
ncbi:MAG: hypothetical protein KBE23_02800 [Chloroflexi bacterium]|nr:hypothetical protein [Chloroflexota bacterium]MBP7041643.1 hypothetical protein [Chloroflexota bacterium]